MSRDDLTAENYFQTFCSLTETFIFNSAQDEPKNGTAKEIHHFRLLALIKHIYRMGRRKFHQMPEAFRSTQEESDWVQEAIIIMFECCKSYDRRGPFDNYVRFMVSKRLTDMQRKIFRRNPPTNLGFFKIIQEMKRDLGREPTAIEVSEHTGRPVDEIEALLTQGFSERVIVPDFDLERHSPDTGDVHVSETREFEEYGSVSSSPVEARPGVTAEVQYIHHEARRVLWLCLEKLLPERKSLFIQHEFKGRSFAKLFKQQHIDRVSLATFKRRYQSEIYDPVKHCVTSQYQIQF